MCSLLRFMKHADALFYDLSVELLRNDTRLEKCVRRLTVESESWQGEEVGEVRAQEDLSLLRCHLYYNKDR